MKINFLKGFYRENLPTLFKKKDLVGVELGVATGSFSKELMNSKKFKLLFGIDSYSLNQHDKEEDESADPAILTSFVARIFKIQLL